MENEEMESEELEIKDAEVPQHDLEARIAARRAQDREQYIAGLREFLNFLEANPELPVMPFPTEYVFCYDRDSFVRVAKILSRGGAVAKEAEERENGDFYVTRKFGVLSVRASIFPGDCSAG